MKTLLLFVAAMLSESATVHAQVDTCAYFSQRNPCGMMVNITGPVYCDDSLDFTCITSESLPFRCGMMDSIGYDVCLYAHDGQWHFTTIHCGTSNGPITDQIALLAPAAAPAGVSTPETVPAVTLRSWPNPVSNMLNLELNDPAGAVTECQIVDANGATIRTFQSGARSLDLSGIPSGAYRLRLLAGTRTVLAQNFVIAH